MAHKVLGHELLELSLQATQWFVKKKLEKAYKFQSTYEQSLMGGIF